MWQWESNPSHSITGIFLNSGFASLHGVYHEKSAGCMPTHVTVPAHYTVFLNTLSQTMKLYFKIYQKNVKICYSNYLYMCQCRGVDF